MQYTANTTLTMCPSRVFLRTLTHLRGTAAKSRHYLTRSQHYPGHRYTRSTLRERDTGIELNKAQLTVVKRNGTRCRNAGVMAQ